MKRFALFLLILTNNAFSSSVELSDGRVLQCQINAGGTRICSDEDSIVFVNVDPHAGTIAAFGGNTYRSGISFYNVKKVMSEYDDVIYNSNEDDFIAPLTEDDIGLAETYQYLQGLHTYLDQSNYDGGEDFAEIKEKVRVFYYNNQEQVINRFDADEFKIGDKTCARFPNAKKHNRKKCSFFKCDDGSLFSMEGIPANGGDIFYDISKDGLWTVRPNDKPIRDKEGKLLANRYSYNQGQALYYSDMYQTPVVTDVGPKDYLPQSMSKQNSLAYVQASAGGWFHFIEKSFDTCENNADVKKIKESYESYLQKLAEQDLIHYITSVNDSITGSYLSPDKLPEYACREGQTYYNPEVFEKAEQIAPKAQDHTMSYEEAEKLFKMAQGMDDIAWKYKLDGCYARAHLMARRFEELGHKIDKAWIKGSLKVVEDNGNEINWNFHVAPVVYIKGSDGKNAPYVIDPSIMDKPVPLSEWSGKMTKHLKAPGSEITRYPFPRNAALFGQAAVSLSNSSPYLPEEPEYISEEEKMKMANSTMTMYRGFH